MRIASSATTSTARSSRSAPAPPTSARRTTSRATAAAPSGALARSAAASVLGRQRSIAARLGHPIGVEHQRVARRQLDLLVEAARVGLDAQQRARARHHLGLAAGAQQDGRRVPAGGHDEARAPSARGSRRASTAVTKRRSGLRWRSISSLSAARVAAGGAERPATARRCSARAPSPRPPRRPCPARRR